MGVAVHHQKVITDIVELVEVASGLAHLRRGDGAHLFIKNGIAQALRLFDLQFGLGQAHFQHAGESQNRPLLHAAFERSRFVNIDHDRFLFGAVPTTHRHRLLCMG